MEALHDIPLISTIKERCRVCYTCVRECPAKAIRIKSGQAAVIEERCIGCGNCVKVCSQGAKQFRRCVEVVQGMLKRGRKVAAIVAPSFPAEFPGLPYPKLVGMIRALGFSYVMEVGFGADLVARAYKQLLDRDPLRRWIASTCPAVIGYVERYHPKLVPNLAPIVSPMIATARVARQVHGDDVKVVFIGPCIAKKREALSKLVEGDVQAALTFLELREWFQEAKVAPESSPPSDFDPPLASNGRLFPITRGLLVAANIDEDLASQRVVSADGRAGVFEAIEEFEKGYLDTNLLDVLACRGCIMGPGFANPGPLYSRRAAVGSYVATRRSSFDPVSWQKALDQFEHLALSRSFQACDQRMGDASVDELTEILERMGKSEFKDELNCGACGYETCREHAKAIHAGLAESEMCLPYTIDQLRKALGDLAVSHRQLADTQEALIHAEKLASMGQLAAGIAHEVNNPLGVVLMYAHLLLEDTPTGSRQREDLGMIAAQADRCKRIVAGLLNFARQNKVMLQPVDLPALVEHSVHAFQGREGVTIAVNHEGDPSAELDRDQMAQVLTNLIANAIDAMPEGGPIVVTTGGDAEHVWFRVQDSGMGIPQANMSKLFEPFFTTKPMGKGTGLGLAVTYGIVKMHRGDIRVESNAEPAKGPTGTTFTVTVPRRPATEF
ncbi:MAG TPA: [Fe-Fe] hydrogenase large subunit C-terminal domain-containing protein [Myxococcales bacterium]|jgi:signal transduction histidine kinase/iron only hydrogenase large subunit-like protein